MLITLGFVLGLGLELEDEKNILLVGLELLKGEELLLVYLP